MTRPDVIDAGANTATLTHRLEARQLSKSYPGVRALHDVSLDIGAGECLALLGENGAGKSTLIKILAGAHAADSGSVSLDGQRLRLTSPLAAQHAGIAVIHQEFNLIPDLSIRDNLFLGRDLTRCGGWLRRGEEMARTREQLERIGMQHIHPDRRCRELTVAEQQGVEIAKSLSLDAKVLILDEPTAALSDHEVDRLLEIIAQLKRDGISLLYVTHRLDEVERVAERICILRDGGQVITTASADLSRRDIIEHMVGRSLDAEFPTRRLSPSAPDTPCLTVRKLTRGNAVIDASLTLHRGEILGLAGLVGAGRTELARLIFGADRADSGSIEMNGRLVTFKSPREAIRAGICLLTEDRKSQGLILEHSLLDNFSLPSLRSFSRFGLLDRRAEAAAFEKTTTQLNIRAHSPHQRVATLSGGNQQKIVLAKWLQRNAEIVIFDEPTRGIDVGAKLEIYRLIHELADAGKAILMISSELPELLAMSDRILVMREGRISGEISEPKNARQRDVLELAMHTEPAAESQ